MTVQPDPAPGQTVDSSPPTPRRPDPGHPLRAEDVTAVTRKRIA